jgi:hypothetical protein
MICPRVKISAGKSAVAKRSQIILTLPREHLGRVIPKHKNFSYNSIYVFADNNSRGARNLRIPYLYTMTTRVGYTIRLGTNNGVVRSNPWGLSGSGLRVHIASGMGKVEIECDREDYGRDLAFHVGKWRRLGMYGGQRNMRARERSVTNEFHRRQPRQNQNLNVDTMSCIHGRTSPSLTRTTVTR